MPAATFIPADADRPHLRHLAEALASVPQDAPLALRTDHHTEPLPLSPTLARLLRHVVQELAEGRALTLIPSEAELSTFQAAHLLGVSRPHLISNLLEAGHIPFHMVGSHRRVALRDVLAYQQEKERRHASADQTGGTLEP